MTASPPPPDVCPARKVSVALSDFGLARPFGNGPKTWGLRVRVRSRDAIVEIAPAITYRVAGKKRTATLKTRTITVDRYRNLRFRTPDRLKRDFRRAGRSLRGAPVTFSVQVKARAQGTKRD